VPTPQRTARIEDDIWDPATARAKAEGASLAALMRAAVQAYATGQLTSQALPASQPAAPVTGQPGPAAELTSQGSAAAIVITGGEPSLGTACAGPGCWQRNTTRYGLRGLPLCPACAAALQGHTYKREAPESAARAIRRGAA